MPSQPIALRWSIGRFRNFTRAHRVCPSLIETLSVNQPQYIAAPFRQIYVCTVPVVFYSFTWDGIIARSFIVHLVLLYS